jgi:hypothetical protein
MYDIAAQSLVGGLLAFRLPGFPLRVVREAFGAVLAIQTQHDGGQAIKQVAVMRDQHERTAEFEQAFFQDFQSGMSKSLVGSSSTRISAGCSISCAMSTRARGVLHWQAAEPDSIR